MTPPNRAAPGTRRESFVYLELSLPILKLSQLFFLSPRRPRRAAEDIEPLKICRRATIASGGQSPGPSPGPIARRNSRATGDGEPPGLQRHATAGSVTGGADGTPGGHSQGSSPIARLPIGSAVASPLRTHRIDSYEFTFFVFALGFG